jgi:adenylate cyclase
MAVFGMFADEPDHGALTAVEAAVAMRDALARHRMAGGKLQFHIGIGINTGEAVAGMMGSPGKLDYTVIGADVNLASRVEAMTKELKAEILLTEATYQLVKTHVEAVDRGLHSIRGFGERKFQLFELVRVHPEVQD